MKLNQALLLIVWCSDFAGVPNLKHFTMKSVVVILVVFICFQEIQAQILQPETEKITDSWELLPKTKSKSNLLIQQINNATTASSMQQEMNFSNQAIINQTGNNHKTVLTQTGSNNEASLVSEGGFTNMNIIQTGNNNSVSSSLSNNTTQLYSTVLQQTGDGNNIELTLLGNNVIPEIDRLVSVTQTGNGLIFTGTYDSPDQPISVDQQSGAGGAGMSVTVNTSAFYFPMK